MHAAMASPFRHVAASPKATMEATSVTIGEVALSMVLLLTEVYLRELLYVH